MTFPLKTSVRLLPAEAEDAQKVASPGTDERTALTLLTGAEFGEKPSAAAVLHAVIQAGLKAVEDEALAIALRRESAFMAEDPECQQWEQWLRSHRGLAFMAEAEADAA